MLAHFPPVPLIIDHIDGEHHVLTPEDEEGIILALRHRNRVRRIRIRKFVPILQKLIIALDGEFPILEFLLIDNQRYHRPVIRHKKNMAFPETFRASHVRELVLDNFATSIESPTLTTMGNLIRLDLWKIPSSAYFHPDVLLQRLSFMPQLETLAIGFNFYNPRREVGLQTLIMTQVTLPNLRWLAFGGPSTYLEALLAWVTIPLLERLQVYLFNRMIYSIPHLRQITSTARNLRLKTATFIFNENCLKLRAYPQIGARLYTLNMELGGKYLDWQVVSAAQVFHALKTILSAVEHLTFKYNRHKISSEWSRQADRTHWRELLGSFDKVKNLRVEDGLIEQVSLALLAGEGESPTDLFPELQELSCPRRGVSRESSRAFTLLIEARQIAGRPITVNRF